MRIGLLQQGERHGRHPYHQHYPTEDQATGGDTAKRDGADVVARTEGRQSRQPCVSPRQEIGQHIEVCAPHQGQGRHRKGLDLPLQPSHHGNPRYHCRGRHLGGEGCAWSRQHKINGGVCKGGSRKED